MGLYGGSDSERNNSTTVCTALTVTPDEDNCLVVFFGGGTANASPSVPGGYSNASGPRIDSHRTRVASLVQGSAAATGAVTSGNWYASSSYYQCGFHAWFRPAAAGGSGGVGGLVGSGGLVAASRGLVG